MSGAIVGRDTVGPGPQAANAPLRGIRVLDLTGTMSGPFCTLLMAQLGARVDKVEPPAGDIVRRLMRGRHDGMTPIFLALNAGKRSAVLDLSTPRGRAQLTALLPEYDVVVHNMRAAAAARLGLTEDGLRVAGSDALLCEIVGFGPGPYQDRPAYDDTIQAISGMAWLQGANGQPEYVRSVVADKTAGLYAAVGVCAALAGRGRGIPVRSIRVPMFEALVAYTMIEQLGGLTFEPPEGPALYPRAVSPHRRPFATADGHVAVMLYTDRHWVAFLTWLGRDDLLQDPRFTQTAERSLAIDEVYGFLAGVLAGRTTREWLEIFAGLDVPASPVLSFDGLLHDPHLAAAGTIVTEEHPTEGQVRRVRTPFTFNGEPAPGLAPASGLGADTEDVLAVAVARPTAG
jgi:crotonobetainyl-CoA:carnitine CoA-transferase CaiB-like acyl-CoA transferase